jgi:SAM-dependent methyltransferase
MADDRQAAIEPPERLKAIRALQGEAEVAHWERDVVAFLEPRWERFTRFPGYFRVQGLNFQLLRQLLSSYFSHRFGTILEIGCGTGLHSLFLSAHADHLVGIDIPGEYVDYVQPPFSSSAEMASFLVRDCFRVEWASFYEAFPDHTPLADGSVDLAFSWTVLEHVPDLPPLFHELARVVKSGGLMVHVVPSVMSALMTLVQANVSAASGSRWSIRRYLRSPRWVIPQLHSEFLRGNATYNDQLDLYIGDTFVHAMLEAGFVIERLVWLRDFNVAVVARKP